MRTTVAPHPPLRYRMREFDTVKNDAIATKAPKSWHGSYDAFDRSMPLLHRVGLARMAYPKRSQWTRAAPIWPPSKRSMPGDRRRSQTAQRTPPKDTKLRHASGAISPIRCIDRLNPQPFAVGRRSSVVMSASEGATALRIALSAGVYRCAPYGRKCVDSIPVSMLVGGASQNKRWTRVRRRAYHHGINVGATRPALPTARCIAPLIVASRLPPPRALLSPFDLTCHGAQCRYRIDCVRLCDGLRPIARSSS